ncbi:hypothetical protein BDW67DRAFT_149769 [Aspergillus spinulosporus]
MMASSTKEFQPVICTSFGCRRWAAPIPRSACPLPLKWQSVGCRIRSQTSPVARKKCSLGIIPEMISCLSRSTGLEGANQRTEVESRERKPKIMSELICDLHSVCLFH